LMGVTVVPKAVARQRDSSAGHPSRHWPAVRWATA
jgi:hypothetical protein